MINISPTLVKSLLVMVITGSSVFAYSSLQPSATFNLQPQQAKAVTEAVKVENISQDYARAHMELMKLPDEEHAKSF